MPRIEPAPPAAHPADPHRVPEARVVPPWLGPALALAGALVGLVLLLGPVLGAPLSRVLGAYDSEGPTHLAGLAARLPLVLSNGPWVLPEEVAKIGFIRANVAPGATVLGWPFHLLAGGGLSGSVLAWNAQFLVAWLAGTLGAWLLVRAWLPEDRGRGAAGTAVALVSCAVFLQQAPQVGRLETLVQFTWPLHVAFLYRATVTRRTWVEAAAAAATFALIALQGGFPALFLALFEVPLATWCWLRSPRRDVATAVLLAVAAAGVAALVPWVLAHLRHPPPPLADFRDSGSCGAAVAQLLPGAGSVPFAHGYHGLPYPGVVLLAAAVWSAVRHRAARLWLGLGLLALLLALGPDLRWSPRDAPLVVLPLGILEGWERWPLPSTGWERIGSFVVPLLVFAAAPLLARRPVVALLVAILGVGEHLAVRPLAAQRAWDPTPPAALASYVAAGPGVVFPDGPLTRLWRLTLLAPPPFGTAYPHTPLVDRLVAISGNPAWFQEEGAPALQDLPARCVARDGSHLAAVGFHWVGLVGRYLPASGVGDATRLLEAGLGAPAVDAEGVQAWPLRVLQVPAGPCQVRGGPPAPPTGPGPLPEGAP